MINKIILIYSELDSVELLYCIDIYDDNVMLHVKTSYSVASIDKQTLSYNGN